VLVSALWSSSSTGVSVVSNDATDTGFATTLAQGTVTISASAVGITGSTYVTVPPPSLVSIIVSPQSPIVALGTSQQLRATGLYSDGSAQDLTASATWTASTSAAAVNITGLVTGVSLGTSTIQATSGSQSGSTAVTVGPPVLVAISLSPANASIALGTSQQYQVTGTYSDGTHQDITNSVEWSCLPCRAVYVGSSGMITGIAQGSATIQAALGTVSGSAILTVTPATLSSLTISPSSLMIDIGGTEQLSATGMYSDYSSTDLTGSSTWVSSNPSIATVSATGFVTALAVGNVTVTATSGAVSGTATLNVGTPTGPVLNTSRYGQSATLLNNGMVLLAGGVSCPSMGACAYLASAELYNPDSAMSSNASNMATPRSAPAVLLPDGRVLIAGGYTCDASGNCASLSSAEIFNMPYSYGYFTAGGSMTAPRSGHTVSLLNDGRVLIAGGQNCSSASSCTVLNTAEIYDPVSGTFTPTGNLNAARSNAVAVTLNQGLVLIAGGVDGSNYPAAAELYDPTTGTFSATASLNAPRANATATVLNTGQVLISGGSTCVTPGCPVSSAEIYDPVAGTFTNTGAMSVARFDHSASLLTNGEVLVAGGYSSCTSTCASENTAEIYDPAAGTFSSAQTLTAARSGQTATVVPSSDVVIAGGTNSGTTLASIDFYHPSVLTPPGLTSIAIVPANPSIPGKMAQQFVALGTFSEGSTQTLRSVVWSSSNQTVTGVTNDSSGPGFVYSTTSGSTVLTATAGSVNGSTLVNTAPSLSYLSISPQLSTLLVGQSLQFSVTGTYSDGSSKDLTASASWTSSNPIVVTMSSTTPGLVSTLGAGNANITARSSGISATASLIVDSAMPTISSLSSTSGSVGAAVTVGGTNFGDLQESSFVTFNSVPAQVFSWSRVSIVVYVPAGASSGPVQVTAGGVGSNSINFSVTQPVPAIAGISELIGAIGDTITISGSGFGTSGAVSFNGATASAISWSDTSVVTQIPAGAQTGPVTITSDGQTSNAITLTIAAPPSVTGVSPSSGDAGTVVTISGANLSTPSSSPIVLFNGIAVQPTNWTSSQITATVPKGTMSGPLTVKVGRLSSNAATFTVVAAGSQSLSISPVDSTVFVGQTVNLSLSDNLEHNIAGALWSLSDNTLAQLSSTDPPVLTASKVGTETVTASYNGLSATTTITIVVGGTSLPLGTVVCALPPSTSAFTVLKIMQAVPSDGTTPDLIAVEDDGAGSIWLRGISSGCSQQWHTRVGSSASGSGVDQVTAESPDNFGGVIVSVANNLNGSSNPGMPSTGSLIRIDGVSGGTSWRYDSPGSFENTLAIDQNGFILVTEDYLINQFQNYSASQLTKIDPNTGAPIANWHWPSSTVTQLPGCTVNAYSETLAPGSGPISVGPDGTYYLSIAWSNTLYWPIPTIDSVNDCDDMTTDSSTTTTSQLMAISPSGAVSTTNLPNPANGPVIPDGNGGALVQVPTPPSGPNQTPPSLQVMDIGGSSATATIQNFTGGDMVLGDKGTYFTTDGNQIMDVEEASGNELWRWQPASGTVQIITATAGGGVAIRHVIGAQEDVVRLDANGNATYDPWSTVGGATGYGVVSNSTYWVNGLWVGTGGDPVIEEIAGNPLDSATSSWPSGQVTGGGGNVQGQSHSPLPQIVTFLPSHLGAPPNPAYDVPDFYTLMESTLNTINVINGVRSTGTPNGTVKAFQRFHDGNSARVQVFQSELNRPLDAIAYIGHSLDANEGTPYQFSFGITFYYPNSNPPFADPNAPWDVLYPNGDTLPPEPNNWGDHKLVSLEKDVSTVLGLNSDPNWEYRNSAWTQQHPSLLLGDKLAPQAKIVFFGACSLNPGFGYPGEVPPFVQMWDVHDLSTDGTVETRARAIIVPVYPPNHRKPDDVELGVASKAWIFILDRLVHGATVTDAVNYANNRIKGDPAYQLYDQGLYWMVLGNHSINLKSE